MKLRHALMVCASLILAFGAVVLVVLCQEPDYNSQRYVFHHGARTIIIEEESWLLGGWGNVYQLTDDNTTIKIGRFGTDDGYRNEGNYDIVWSDSGAEISYSFQGREGDAKTIYVTFE